MIRLRQLSTLLLVVGGLLANGCNRLPDSQPVAEVTEPSFVEGKRFLRQGQEQAALSEFFKVLDSRRDGAPESHLEVGLLYQLEIKDPVAAIYHFRRYLELKPNAPQADLVRQRIDSATRDFARTLPAQPVENQLMRNAVLDVVEELKNENMRLKDELSRLRGNPAVSAPVPRRSDSNKAITSVPETSSRISTVPDEVPPMRQLAPPTRPPAERTAPAVRMHTVVKGDTLSNLSRRYFGTPSRFWDIFAANRDKMRSENDLQIGMQLVIPN
ncbi:MAG: LysM peptidoglycan-binding domain-containing protein [Candidatus Synoicihabitans palmerolidicus]|nr:LysM peptidoglycan-binding domain-containing protein [Candidatus Synoicihabitans palmerolidicus]MCC5025691.1 LysM peptidoglycan-binding domain-containing protein [Candidatus Synoicihabitans palmerolidicus]